MENAFALISRELILLLLVTLFGWGPSVPLERVVAPSLRIALMPAIGFALGTCVFTTLLWFFPASSTYWILLLLAAGSSAVGLFCRTRQRLSETDRAPDSDVPARRGRSDVLKLLILAVVVAAPLSFALLQANSVGPTTYQVYDMADYIAFQDAAQHQSIHEAETTRDPDGDLVQSIYTYLMTAGQETEMSPLAANVNELLGVHATDTVSAYLIAVLVTGGLGMFAAISVALGASTWWAVFGGCLFAGSFFMQLFFDGSEGAICGLVMLAPLTALGVIAVRGRRSALLVPAAIVLAGLIAFYPILMEVVAPVGGVSLLAAGVRSGALTRREWRTGLSGLAKITGVAILAIVLDIVGFLRAGRIWAHALLSGFAAVGFPQYDLHVNIIPGWLFQMTGFYSFAISPNPGVGALRAWVVPAVLGIAILVALRRDPIARIALAGVAVCVVGAAYQALHGHCSYCEDRELLPLAVIAMFLMGLGLGRLARSGLRFLSWAALPLATLALGFISHSAYTEFSRFTSGSFFLQAPVRHVLAKLPSGHGVVEVEGFSASPEAPGELPIAYDLAYEVTGGRISLAADHSENSGLAYLGVWPLNSTAFRPRYDYVLTRVPGIVTSRRVIARADGVALEMRMRPLDVTVDTGISVPVLPSENPSGAATVVGPLEFVVAGQSRIDPSVVFTLAVPPGSSPSELATLRHLGKLAGSTLTVYATTSGSATIHTVTVSAPAFQGARLTSMKVFAGRCPPLSDR